MDGRKSFFRVFQLTVVCVGLLYPQTGLSFSIDSVTVVPEDPITPDDSIELVIDISTPSAAAILYSPTDVIFDHPGKHIDVSLYVDSGCACMIDHITEVVELGNASPGTYHYDVELIPGHSANWGTRNVSGEFTVVPAPSTIVLLLSTFPVLLRRGRRIL